MRTMRFLLMIIMVLLIATSGWGLTSTTIFIFPNQLSSDYSYISIPFDLSDTTNIEKRYLYLGVTGSSAALYDSITSGFTDPDTFLVTGLLNGTSYTFYISARDTTANDSTFVYSDRSTYSTTNYTQTVGDSGITLSSAYCYWDSSVADTGIAHLVLIYGLTNPPTTRTDSSSATNRVDTTFQLTGLMNGATYYYYFEAADSAITDSSAIGSFTTIDFTSTETLSLLAGTATTITITIVADTTTDFNGVDSVNLFEGVVADSFLDVATLTLAETLTVTMNPAVITGSDTVWFFWGTVHDSIEVWSTDYLVDSTLGDSITTEFISTGLASITKYYYSAVVCSADVYDSIAIDSVTTTSLSTAIFTRTGKFRDGQYHYWAQVYDSIYIDSIANDSILIPPLRTWKTSDVRLTWDNPSSMPSVQYSVDGIETVYYKCWMTGATYRDADSLKLFVYDETWGLETAIDSSGFIVTDTITIAVDSVACNNKDLIEFKIVARHPTAVNDIVGELQIYIEIQDRPF